MWFREECPRAFIAAARVDVVFSKSADRRERSQFRIARVVEVQRRMSRVAGEFDGWADVSGRVRHHAISAADFPAVGDWVGVAAAPGAERGVILRRLERRSVISRRAAGRAVNQQVLAANVDTVFLVTAFTQDLNPRRLERYLTMVWDLARSRSWSSTRWTCATPQPSRRSRSANDCRLSTCWP